MDENYIEKKNGSKKTLREKKRKEKNLVSRNERFSERKDWALGLEV